LPRGSGAPRRRGLHPRGDRPRPGDRARDVQEPAVTGAPRLAQRARLNRGAGMIEDDDPLSPEELSALRGAKSLPASLEDATVARLRAMGVLREPGFVVRPLPGFLALCGSFLLGLAAWPLVPALHQRNDRPQFMLLLYGDPQRRTGQGHRDEYVAW